MSCSNPFWRLPYDDFEKLFSKKGHEVFGCAQWDKWRNYVRNGGVMLSFDEKQDFKEFDRYFQKCSCGQCIGCRIKYSRDWSLRIMLEAQQYQKNCFLTLT